MSYSLTDLEDLVLDVLRDEGLGPHLWADAELDRAIATGVTLLSEWFPQAEIQTVTFTPGFVGGQAVEISDSNSQALGYRLLGVRRVELPSGTEIPQEPWDGTTQFGRRATRRTQQAYRWRRPELWLRIPVGRATDARVWLTRTFAYPSATGPLDFDGDEVDVEIVVLAAARAATTYVAGSAARQGRTVVAEENPVPTDPSGGQRHYEYVLDDVPPWVFDRLIALFDTQLAELRAARGART